MSKNKDKDERIAGIFGILVLVFIVALFVVFMSMIPNILTWIEETLSIDEFASQIIFFIALMLGITGFSYIGWMYMPKRK